ncbi:TIGR03936 family radical SAM-associated protein [Chloroflexota bacterium]
MQRLRIRFCRGQELKFISHLDIMRLWQRALNRAGISLAYSEGFTPHPRISLAVPLALGITSEAELMDIVLTKWISPHSFNTSLSQQLPPGIEMQQVYQMPLTIPSLQSQVRYAEYEVELENEKGQKEIESAITSLLSLEHLPWQHQRDTGPRHYDLRVLIDDLWLIDSRSGYCTIGMRLRCDSSGSGRPEQVSAALGYEHHPQSIHRTKLILKTG